MTITLLLMVLVAVLGAMAAYLLQLILSIPRYMWRYLISREKARIEGTWFEYHYTQSGGTPELTEQKWIVKKGLSGTLVVEARSLRLEDVSYRGTVQLESNHWVLTVDGVNHVERVMIRLLNPISTVDRPLLGLWAGLDFDGNAGAGPILLIDRQLKPEDAESLLREIDVDEDHKLLGYSPTTGAKAAVGA